MLNEVAGIELRAGVAEEMPERIAACVLAGAGAPAPAAPALSTR